ncbi:hypothetical protein [Curtobacterium sp. TXMA1]|uniref:hypothetical protein n=1 Tax=Curtobacterium sp. TXMA1 TaxID=2876939 RepID=UPI001CCC132B|nr:hypothetical protein [Curtobacterium sp. TXMA1]UBQ02746.1 hypothetical protein LCG91_00815 [Curtobacterium sp. TXMA1]
MLVALAALLVIVAGYSALTLLGLNANAISAVATAIAAIAAFASASSSSTAARESVRALSYATKPTLSLDVRTTTTGELTVYVANGSLQPAVDVVVRWRLRDGRSERRNLGDLRADTLQSEGLSFGHQGPGVTLEVEPAPGPVSGTDRFEVEYGSTLGATRWVAKWEFQVTYQDDGETAGYSQQVVTVGERELPSSLR